MKPELPYIIFEVTSVCNLKCRYCYNHWKCPDAEDLQLNSYKKARKTLKRLFKVADVGHVTFTGGEPFLAERFAELVLFTRMKKKGVTMISNGSVATKEDYKMMIDLGVGLFEFPLHSATSASHNFMTNSKNAWEKSVQSVRYVQELGGQVVVVLVITKVNYKEIPETLSFIKDLGLKHVMLNRFNIGGSGIAERTNLELSKEELNHAFRLANDAGTRIGLTMTSNVCTPWCLVNHREYKAIRFSTCSSSVYGKPVTLDIEGNLRICNHSPHIIGNIYKDNLQDLLDSEYVKSWGTVVPDFCNSCDIWDKCFGGCRAASEQMGSPISRVDPALEQK